MRDIAPRDKSVRDMQPREMPPRDRDFIGLRDEVPGRDRELPPLSDREITHPPPQHFPAVVMDTTEPGN